MHMRKKKEKHEEPTYAKTSNKVSQRYKSKSQHSILHKHEQKMTEFKNRNDRICTLDKKINNIKRDIEKLSKEQSYQQLNNNFTSNICSQIQSKKNELDELQNQRLYIQSGDEEIDYLLESSIMISEYLKLDEQEKQLLEIAEYTKEQAQELNSIVAGKNDITDKYFSKFDEKYVSTKKMFDTEANICSNCNVVFETESGFLVCPSCGICVYTFECNGELSFKEMQDYDYRPQFTYEKMTHLEDWLRRFQAKENRAIPQEILDKVVLEARKERIRDLNILTEEKVKRYLKKLSLNDYYDNVIGIINRINGRPPFRLTTEIEDKIKSMFQQIQEPFEKHKPQNRRNFLSYSYTLHKFFQILGLHEFSKYFQLLKSADKLRQQDDIFKKIVAEMASKDKTINWVFYPSI